MPSDAGKGLPQVGGGTRGYGKQNTATPKQMPEGQGHMLEYLWGNPTATLARIAHDLGAARLAVQQ